ncbi:MAG: tetraacyldisaccharide 4-kinase [Blastocatellia bacterium]|jgi:tetraacyldisaccharide 4'-kinase|nr:tetraacyldisaccharide 4-kinase [Blastocatellia bacterium]
MNSAVTFALTPLGSLYGVAMKIRRALYQSGRFRVHELGKSVISVGNLTTGGTGKTPLVEWIAKELAQTGHRPCILTRGYARRNAGNRVIVSDGNEVMADAARAGDEPLLLAENLKGLAAVISDADRISAAHWAIQNLQSDVFVLDDGFQHLRVARQLNIVTIDATNPWGNGKLIPAGVLRESPFELARADCIVITRADDPNQTEALQREINAQSKGRPIFHSRMRLSGVRAVPFGQPSIAVEQIGGLRVAAFCALGNPESFFALLRRNGYQLAHTQVFRDHHSYTQSDIDQLVREAIAHGAQILLTTAKDEVKLRSLEFELPCYTADIEIEIENQEKLRALIADAITAPG